ncbi:MAG TPA: hypothetical protein VK899_03345 [Gemmatimonadales bacterium]|nr:hypothetical protein [Gemmatimonadales bacterium]
MTATLPPRRPIGAAKQTLEDHLAPMHDRWMADCDVALGPVTDRDATFLQRWAAIRYIGDTFPERFQLEQDLVEELHPFILAEMRERLNMQMDRLVRLQQELDALGHQRGTARQIARAAREMVDALRLWYTDIEFAVGGLQLQDIGPRANALLDRCTSGAWFGEFLVG